MRNAIYFLFVFLAGFATSCELMVDVDVPFDGPRIVVNGLFTPDSVMTVILTEEKYILKADGPYTPITSATVSVTDQSGNAVANLEHIGHGWYRSPTRPIAGASYNIRIEAPGYSSVQAVSVLPDVVPIIDAVWDSTIIEPGSDFGTEMPTLEMTFRDPPGRNYYMVLMYLDAVRTYQTGPNTFVTDTVSTIAYLNSDDPIYDGENLGSGAFTDVLFEGREVTIKYRAYGGFGEIINTNLVLMNLGEDYYKYHTTGRLQDDVGFDPFAQPVKVFNNVQGGLGVFAGAASATWRWD